MYSTRYYVDREAGTYSDALAAFGLAYLLSRALQDAGVLPQITLEDCGTTYLIQLSTSMTPEIVSRSSYPHELLPFLQDDRHPEGASNYSIGEQIALLRSRTAKAASEVDTEQGAQLAIREDFPVFALIEQLQGGRLLNRLAGRLWNYRQYYPDLLRIALSIYSDTPNRLQTGRKEFAQWRKDRKADDFSTDDSLLAIFDPTWQKSINRAKLDGPENKNHDGFWLPEFLKIVGLPLCGLVVSVRIGQSQVREEDKKVYVLAPARVNLDTHTTVMKAFSTSIHRTSSVKADIEVLLNYIGNFLIYIQRLDQRKRFGRIRDAVDGFYCAYFKKSGSQRSAFSLTNLPYLQMPTWVQFQALSTEEIAQYQDIIEHQHDVLFYRDSHDGKFDDFIDENQSEGASLLRSYRDFLSRGDLSALLDFYSGFGALIMHQAAQKKPYRQFQLSQIRRLLIKMTPTLQQMLEDEGFREVARAIRLCTVTAQRLKTKKVKIQHEIRYGLAQDLKRKAPFKGEFTSAIMAFINQYQAENARARERGKTNIHEVTTTDVRHLAALIDACPNDSAEPVASLLLAFGYAYDDDPKEEEFATDDTAENSQGATQ